jgi:hypothetical protein
VRKNKEGQGDRYELNHCPFLKDATEGLTGPKAKVALIKALDEIRDMLNKNPDMPYKGGL